MITLIAIIVLAFLAAGVVFLVLCLFGGLFYGIAENLIWLWHKAHGRDRVPPWRKGKQRAGYNRLPVPAEVRARVMARDGFACVYCTTEHDLTVDHVIPRYLGGGNGMDNLVTACRPCNSSKGTGSAPGSHRRARQAIVMLWRAERVASRNGHGGH